MVKQMTKILEMYLREYCEVNGIDEKKIDVSVYSDPENKYASVLDATGSKTKIGIKLTDEGFEISGEILSEKEKFPKTIKFIESI